MMNYKLVNKPGDWAVIPDTDDKYVTSLVDIVETTTEQVIATMPSYPGQAKALCRHLNLGGGFDGWTPAFFLNTIPKSIVQDED